MDLDVCRLKLSSQNVSEETNKTNGEKYRQSLAVNLFGRFNSCRMDKVMSYSDAPSASAVAANRVIYDYHDAASTKSKPYRQISSSPSRILDAPDLRDDYYLNLLSWNNEKILAVALNQTVYLWNSDTGVIEELPACSGATDYVTSVQWTNHGGANYLAIGTDTAQVQLWDATTAKQVRCMKGHTGRVGSLAWNGMMLSSGSRDSSIFQHDVRGQRQHVATYRGHSQEVCGLTWSPDGATLASGGNDNMLCLWDKNFALPATANSSVAARQVLTGHQAAVKALAWCPWERNVLASGGGTADRTIKFWNTSTGALQNSIDTNSQVCGLLWSKSEKEILSSHGFSHYQLCLWKYPTMSMVKELKGHTARVLHMAMSPDGSTVVSAAADETLRFWDIFPVSAQTQKTMERCSSKYASIAGIR